METFGANQDLPDNLNINIEKKRIRIGRRGFLKTGLVTGLLGSIGAIGRQFATDAFPVDQSENISKQHEESIQVDNPPHLKNALAIAASTYPADRIKDQLSFTNKSGYRMTISPNGFPVAICMCPDLTFGMLGSSFI